MRINFIPYFLKSRIEMLCPDCKKEMYVAYLDGQVIYCKDCKKTYELFLNKSKTSFEQLQEDGWVKEKVVGVKHE